MHTSSLLNYGHDFLWIKRLSQQGKLFYASKQLLWLIICLGLVLRLAEYLTDGSLELDEARLALNIVNRSFLQLLQPLDYEQGAPIGFLVIEKLAVQIFGNTEYALRLFPFFAGAISLLLFYRIASYYLTGPAIPIALGLFAISTPLVFYASAAKQYSSDVAIGLLLYWVTIYIQPQEITLLRLGIFGITGAIAVWFSHPAIFILAGVAGNLTLFCIVRKEWLKMGQYLVAFLLWAFSLVISYFVSLRALSSNMGLLNYWDEAFMPFPPLSFTEVRWFSNAFFEIFEYLVGVELSVIAAFIFLVGCILMFVEQREKFLTLISPLLFTLIASGFHKYPFSGRLLLFFIPSVLLLMAEGTQQIKITSRYGVATLVGSFLVGVLLLHPTLSSVKHYIGTSSKEDIKPVITYLKAHQMPGDTLYLYYGAQDAFKFYAPKYGYDDEDYITGSSGRRNLDIYADELDKLQGRKRVWILFSHIYNWENFDEQKFFLYYLDRMGTRLDSFKSEGAIVYLYDLSKKAPVSNNQEIRKLR